MMRRRTGITLASLIALTTLSVPAATAATAATAVAKPAAPQVRVNQVGYTPNAPKSAYVMLPARVASVPFTVTDAQGAVVYRGLSRSDAGSWSSRYQAVYLLSFTRLRRCGTYRVHVGAAVSPAFTIASGTALYGQLVDNAVRYFTSERDGADVVHSVLDREPANLTDQRATVYQTWDELAVYCRNVAGSVGRLSLGVFNPPALHTEPKQTEELADKLGLALQLTNILRDVREDLQGGRVYLPQNTLDEHGCELRLLEDGTLDPQGGKLAAVLRYEAERAESLYAEGLALLPLLDWRSRGCCGALSGIYHALLKLIAAQPEATFGQRLSLPTKTKLAVAARALRPRLPDVRRGR